MDNISHFGLKLKKMGEELQSQTSKILEDSGLRLDKRSLPVLIQLAGSGKVKVKELAILLGMTHPAIVQVASSLKNKGYISITKSNKDRRVTYIGITGRGRNIVSQIGRVMDDLQNSFELVIDSIDANFPYSLMKLDRAVRSGDLLNNYQEIKNREVMKEIKIIPYKKKYNNDFRRLNYEWLEKYFEVEEEDEKLLNYPEKEIIKKGGEIFFALLNNEVVGTCAVLQKNAETYELTKMAVTEKAQGKQIGKKLSLTAIGFAVEKNARQLILSTSHKLVVALNLYKSLGFTEVTPVNNSRYKRELIHLALNVSG